MNLILFSPEECTHPLPTRDVRARHIREVLRREVGGEFDCGLVDGPRGRARVEHCGATGLRLSFIWESTPPPPLFPITLLVGMPRPQTARKILSEATALGVERMLFFTPEKGERSYGTSSLWSSGEVRRLLVAGAEQAFCTRLPQVTRPASLRDALAAIPNTTNLVALDNYEAGSGLGEIALAGTPAVLAIGPERGWSGAERDALRDAGFALAHLGTRVLRTETACTAALAMLKTRLGLW